MQAERAAAIAFLLTPLREGRPSQCRGRRLPDNYFYSRPCGRGDAALDGVACHLADFYSRPCGRGDILRSAMSMRAIIAPLTRAIS